MSETKSDLSQIQHEKIQTEITKLMAETILLNKKSDWHAARIAATLLGSGVALGVALVKFIPLIF